MAQFELWFDTDLSQPQKVHAVQGNVFSQDRLANKIGVRVKNNGTDVNLSGTVTGYIIRADDTTVTVSGTRSGNTAYVILPEAAYAVVGQIQVSIQLTDGNAKTTLCACTGYVHRSMTDTIIDPGNAVDWKLPSYPTTNGTYRLRCVVSNGNATLSWVSE